MTYLNRLLYWTIAAGVLALAVVVSTGFVRPDIFHEGEVPTVTIHWDLSVCR